MKTIIYVQDIECDSCTKIIERSLKLLQGINGYLFRKDHVEIDYDPSLLKEETLIDSITKKGYKASNYPLTRLSYKKRFADFFKNKKKYAVERKMLAISLVSFLTIIFLEAAIYVFFFSKQAGFLARNWQWFIYLDISIVTIAAALWHLKAYKGAITSMTGMMLGMTLGMQAGFMVGAVIGATNGMFVGSTVGMLAGIILGVVAGKESGIMGALQGMMSGLMGGTMGAMITVMMLTDNVFVFMPLFMLVNVAILWGMSYMVYEEMVEDKKVKIAPADFTTFFSFVFVAIFILGVVMVYGPKSLLVAVN
ncbi:MAG: heavy-metal-associated domain-containing protein [Nanoarchaeota archaeon]